MTRRLLITLVLTMLCAAAHSQIITYPGKKYYADSVKRDFSNQPYFGLYKDNYFVFGSSVGPKPTKANTDVKFQISIAHRLHKGTIFWGTYLYLFYSQKAFWNVMENSMPFRDLNFNPGLGLTKPLFYRDRYIGKATLILEHESNGRDSIQSRSWNRVALASNIIVTPNLMVHGKIWVPIVDGENNRDIVKYCGIYQAGFQYISSNRRFIAGLTLVKRGNWKMDFNTIAEVSWRFIKHENQFIFLQYYNGFGQGLLDYNQFASQLRVGIVIRPQLFSDF